MRRFKAGPEVRIYSSDQGNQKAEELLERLNYAVDWSEIEPATVLEDDEEDDPE